MSRQINNLDQDSSITSADELIGINSSTTAGARFSLSDLRDWFQANLSIPTNISDVLGLQAALDDKASIDHTHTIAQVSGLQNELDSKYDASSAGIIDETIIIGANSVNVLGVVNDAVANITGVSPTDARIPSNVTAGNRLVFTSADGTIGEETPQQFKADLLLNNVDNTADLNKPISSAVQDALDDKLSNTFFTDDKAAQDALISANTAKNGITDEQSAAIVANTAKITYPASDSSKLAGIETGADVTDTTNVWSSLGISTEGRTNYALSERGVFVAIPDSAGNVQQLVTSVSTNQTAISAGGGVAQFTITGVATTVVNVSIVNSIPANWISNTSFSSTTVTLDSDGVGTVNVTVPNYTLTDNTRSFQVQAQVEGAFQAAVTSEVVTQYTTANLLTSVSLSVVNFGNAGVTEALNIVGVANTQFNVELFQVTPAGWIATGALSATSGVLDGNGLSSSITITIPTAQDDTVNRSFRIRVRATSDLTQLAESPVISQVHTQSTAAGNLIVAADAIYSTPNIDFYTSINQGDAPFEIVLNNNATDKTVNPLHTVNIAELHERFNTDDIDNAVTGNFIEFNGTKYRWDYDAGTSALNIWDESFADLQTTGFIDEYVIFRIGNISQVIQPSRTSSQISIEGIDSSSQLGQALIAASAENLANTLYFGNANIQFEKTANFQLNVGSGEYTFTTDDTGEVSVTTNTGSWNLVNIGGWLLLIGNTSYLPGDGRQATVSFGGHSETVTQSGGTIAITDTDLINAIQASGTMAFPNNFIGTSTISFVANPGAPTPPADGSTDYYLHVSDNDGDIVVAMETINIDNQAPTGSIAQTEGAASPADGSTVEFTATFMDAESNPFNYQWQYAQVQEDTQSVTLDGDDLFLSGLELTFDINETLVAGSLTGFVATVTVTLGDITITVTSNTANTITADITGASSLITGGTTLNFVGDVVGDYADIAGETGVTYEFEAANRVTAVWENLPSTLSLPAVGATINLATSSFTIDDDFFGPSISQELTTQLVSIDIADGTTGTKTLTVVFDHVGISDGVGTTDSNTVLSSWSLVVDGDTTYTQDATTAGLGDRQVDDFSEAEVFPGLYRCQVTAVQGDTAPVNSNEIELT